MLRAVAPIEEEDRSITVAAAAVLLGCDDSTVRAMIRAKQLRGHKVGKGRRPGGVRVSEASVVAYKRRNAIGGEVPEEIDDAPAERLAGRNPAHSEAMAYLRRLGAV